MFMVGNKNQVIQDIPQEKEGEEIRQFIKIRLGEEIYGIPIEETREVTRTIHITNIPGTASHIMGLMNLHGEILCVVDVKIILNMGKMIPTENSRIVVIKTMEGPVGAFRDEVIGIYDTLRKDIEAPFSTLSNEIGNYINGQVQTYYGLMGILDIKRLLFK